MYWNKIVYYDKKNVLKSNKTSKTLRLFSFLLFYFVGIITEILQEFLGDFIFLNLTINLPPPHLFSSKNNLFEKFNQPPSLVERKLIFF